MNMYATCREIFHTWTRHNFCRGRFWRPLFFGFCLQATAESLENDSGYRVGIANGLHPRNLTYPLKIGLLPQRGNDHLPFPSIFRGELYNPFHRMEKDPLQSRHILTTFRLNIPTFFSMTTCSVGDQLNSLICNSHCGKQKKQKHFWPCHWPPCLIPGPNRAKLCEQWNRGEKNLSGLLLGR